MQAVAHIARAFNMDPCVVLDDEWRFDFRLACLRVLQEAEGKGG